MLTGVDLTLGGLNQDLPEPPDDCLTAPEPSGFSGGCLDWTAEYNGTLVQSASFCTTGAERAYVYAGNLRFARCYGSPPMPELGIGVALGDGALGPLGSPYKVFTVSGPPVDFETTGYIYMQDEARNLVTYEVSRTNIMDTHDYSFRIAGVSNPTEPYDTQKHPETLKGVFAATATPKAGCVPDASGFGCDTVRVRGSFFVRSLTP